MLSFQNKTLPRTVVYAIIFASCVVLAPREALASDHGQPSVVFSRNGVGLLTADTKVTLDSLRKLFAGCEIAPVVYSDEGGEARGFELRRQNTKVLFIQVDGTRIVRVGAYAAEVDSELGIHVGDAIGRIRARLPSFRCDVDAEYGDGVVCVSPSLPNLRFRFDARFRLDPEDKSSRVTMMEWVPPAKPGATAK